MPVPIQLVVFSVSFNRFTSLPEWLTDLPHIETICAHHNLIRYLPYRLAFELSQSLALELLRGMGKEGSVKNGEEVTNEAFLTNCIDGRRINHST